VSGEPNEVPGAEAGREGVAIALWWATFVVLCAAAVVWIAPPLRAPKTTPPIDGGTPADPANHGGTNPGGVPSGPDLHSFVACPPVAGRPTKEELDAALRTGAAAYLKFFAEPALANADSGGFLDYVDAAGKTTRLGPGVYVQCQLYLIVHLLMFCDDLGIPREHPTVQRALRFLVKEFDATKGCWKWSIEGCLHAKGLAVLARFGERAKFEAGWRWALASPMHREEDGLFTMMQCGAIVQTLGPAARSLSGVDAWEHGGPIVDEENVSKFQYALWEAGRRPDDPEVAALETGLARYFASTPLAAAQMQTKDVVGRAWSVLLHARWRLPESDGFRLELAELRVMLRDEWRVNFMMRMMPNFRADVVRALLEVGDRGDTLDAMVHGFVASQEADGAWRSPQILALWGLATPPKQGWKFGNMDGATTYTVLLAIAAYRRAIYGAP
jgi:hypothetical protein